MDLPWLDSVKDRLLSVKRIAGIEIILLPDEAMLIRGLVLEKEKSSIRIQQTLPELNTLEQLKELLPENTPCVISLNGRGILSKQFSGALEEEQLITSLLPNAKPADFYQQVYRSDKQHVVSIVRKTTVHAVLDQLSAFPVLSLNTGPFEVMNLLPLLTDQMQDQELKFGGHRMQFAGEVLSACSFSPNAIEENNTIKIDTETLPAKLLNSYAIAFSALLNSTVSGFEIEAVQQSKEEFTYKELFKVSAYAIGGLMMGILLINFILFSTWTKKHNDLQAQESRYSGILKEMESLEKEVKQKNSFLSEAGWLSSWKSSFYADRIAATVPASVKLTVLAVNPINDKQSKEIRKTVFEVGTIFLSGSSSRPTELNEWISKLKELKNVRSAKLLNYTYDAKSRAGNFNVEITLQD